MASGLAKHTDKEPRVRTDRPDPPPTSLRQTHGIPIDSIGEISGGPIVHVRAGWFVPAFDAGRAHWYDVERDQWMKLRRLCDRRLHWPAELFEPGSWRSCKRCRRMIGDQA